MDGGPQNQVVIEFSSHLVLRLPGCRDVTEGETVSDSHRALQPRPGAREESPTEQVNVARLRTDPSQGESQTY